jgi:anti-sigma factor ChrR (cupin superfamily)
MDDADGAPARPLPGPGPGARLADLDEATAHPERLAWRPLRPGVGIHSLHEAPGGPHVALLWYEPGASVPAHVHEGHEMILVLSGAQHDERGRYARGALVLNAPGTSHSVWSPEGCLVLITWERPVRFL